MGLVAQAPIDTLFAPQAAMPGAATPAAIAPEGDLFAALLASLTGDIPAETTPEGTALAAGSSLAAIPGEPTDDDAKNDGGIAAAIAALQLMPQITPILPGPLDGGHASTSEDPSTGPAAATTAVADVAPLEGDASEAPATPTPVSGAEAAVEAVRPTSVESTEAPVIPQPGDEVPDAAPQPSSEHQRATPATPGRGDSPTVAATPAGPAMEVVAANRARRDERKLERKGDEPPATEATSAPPPGAQESAASVVRFDGNADNQGRRNGQQNASREGNEPNASVQGIAHAAANSAVGELRTVDAAPVTEVPQPEPAAPAAPEAVEHVGRTIIEKIEQGGGEARLHLRPEALGEVTLHIRTDGDSVHVEIHAERAEAANLLRDHTRDLSQLLGERGLNLADVHVDLSWQGPQDQQGGQETGQQRRPEAEDNSFASLMGLEDPGPAERHNRLRSAYNPDGAMSYRV